MKKSLFLFIVLLASIVSNAQTRCTSCNGYGRLICSSCNGSGVIYQQVYNPYSYSYQNVPYRCQSCNGSGQLICASCRGNGHISFRGTTYKIDQLKSVTVRLEEKCDGHGGSLCSCKKYVGFQVKGHTNGWYYGKCLNRGCGHRPSAHGLHEAQ